MKEDEGKDSLKILLVEDLRDNQLLIKAYLKKTNHSLEIADNGQIAVDKFFSGDFDLVLMDMQMPVMDGYTATRYIREKEKDEGREPTPIIALSAFALDTEISKSLDAGCDTRLTKPIRMKLLLETILQYGRKTTV